MSFLQTQATQLALLMAVSVPRRGLMSFLRAFVLLALGVLLGGFSPPKGIDVISTWAPTPAEPTSVSKCFSPPKGIDVISTPKTTPTETSTPVSVPRRGLMSFLPEKPTVTPTPTASFSPPKGIDVISTCGPVKMDTKWKTPLNVSVPRRGLMSFLLLGRNIPQKNRLAGFSPPKGIDVISTLGVRRVHLRTGGFSPPKGIDVISTRWRRRPWPRQPPNKCFSPPKGIDVISTPKRLLGSRCPLTVSVPRRGLMSFLRNGQVATTYRLRKQVSVPRRGLMSFLPGIPWGRIYYKPTVMFQSPEGD
jgi:hypothetical protein